MVNDSVPNSDIVVRSIASIILICIALAAKVTTSSGISHLSASREKR